MTLFCWDCGADMVPMPEIRTHERMLCTGCGLSSPRDITERMNVRRAGEIADMRLGTPCIVCGAPILQDIGHDKGCALEWQNTAHLTPAVSDPCHPAVSS